MSDAIAERNNELAKAFAADFSPYFNHYPFMSHDANGECDGNAILYSGTYGVLFNRLFGRFDGAGELSARLYREAFVPTQPGIITRGSSKWEDPQTYDDYIGLCTVSLIDGRGAAVAIAEWGKNHHWSYVRKGHENWKEWIDAQFWRIPGVVQHIKLCAGIKLNILDRIILAAAIYENSFAPANDTSGTILKWHMISSYSFARDKNWLCNWAVKKWKEKLIAKCPNAMGDVFGVYYGFNHPFSKWSMGII